MIERGDHDVIDEPFSAHYYFGEQKVSDRFDVVEPASRPEDIVAAIAEAAARQPVFVKDMAYHADGFANAELLSQYRNSFLIREPAGALASLAAKWPDFTQEEAGYDALARLVAIADGAGQDPVIIDHDDLCRDPAGMVRAYCERMDIDFDASALTWSPGMRPEWSRWADWHESSAASTGFLPPPSIRPQSASDRVREQAERCRPIYDELHRRRLRPVEAP